MNPLILHHNDHDGFAAAWVWMYFHRDQAFDTMAVQYGTTVPLEMFKGRDVVVLDFSFGRAETQDQISVCSSYTLIDHHRSAVERLESLQDMYSDYSKPVVMLHLKEGVAACELVARYLSDSTPMPDGLCCYTRERWWLQAIALRDVWKHEVSPILEHQVAYIRSLSLNFARLSSFDGMSTQQVQLAERYGAAILRQISIEVGLIARNASKVILGDYAVPLVVSAIHQSEVGKRLCQDFPNAAFAVCAFRRSDGKWVHSLRSSDPEKYDVSTIASKYGGGGHAAAAGFVADSLYEDMVK